MDELKEGDYAIYIGTDTSKKNQLCRIEEDIMRDDGEYWGVEFSDSTFLEVKPEDIKPVPNNKPLKPSIYEASLKLFSQFALAYETSDHRMKNASLEEIAQRSILWAGTLCKEWDKKEQKEEQNA